MLCLLRIPLAWRTPIANEGTRDATPWNIGGMRNRICGFPLRMSSVSGLKYGFSPDSLFLCAERPRSTPLILQEMEEQNSGPMKDTMQLNQVKPSRAEEIQPVQEFGMSNGNMVHTVIPAHLREVEQQYHVKVLLAVESGSRAWGFESLNSDWDVRFIYVHRPEWYFRIEDQRDVIEHMYDDDVDLAGWELRKALGLLRRCNPSLLEWIHSPVMYEADSEFYRRVLVVERDFFQSREVHVPLQPHLQQAK